MPPARHTVQAITATVAATLAMACLPAQAAFEGRQGNATDGFVASTTCTSSGPGKCTYFYDTTLGVTILNDWNIGTAGWDRYAAPGSAQALLQAAGQAASGLPGWMLPDDALGTTPIWNSVGKNFAALSSQFDGVQAGYYWVDFGLVTRAYAVNFAAGTTAPFRESFGLTANLHFFAIRQGDLVSAVPEPQAYLMLLLGVGVVAGVTKRRRLRA